jgi:hypothetical protein
MFHDGTKMLFLGNTVTQAAIVDLCTAASGCQANFTAEIVQAQVSADYTQSALPMQIAAFGSFSTMMDQGTPNRGQTLSPTNMSSACGLQHSGSDYGNCAHLDIDEASGYLTCGNLTNFNYQGSQTPVRRTVPSIRRSAVPLAVVRRLSTVQAERWALRRIQRDRRSSKQHETHQYYYQVIRPFARRGNLPLGHRVRAAARVRQRNFRHLLL